MTDRASFANARGYLHKPTRWVDGEVGQKANASERGDTMDRWERRLHQLARAGVGGASAVPAKPSEVRSEVIDARDRLLIPSGIDPIDLIHPDEAPAAQSLLQIADRHPDFHAEITLLARNRDRWEHHRFEVTREVMGPVLRLVDSGPYGAAPVAPPAPDAVSTASNEEEAQVRTQPADALTNGVPTADDGRVGEESSPESESSDQRISAPRAAGGPIERNDLVAHVAGALERADTDLVAVLLIDIDRFKVHNDALGPQLGDEMLSLLDDRIRRLAVDHFCGALGGDEFAVVMEGVDRVEAALEVAEAIRARLSDPLEIDGDLRNISATIGLAVGGADVLAEHLVRDADTALFAGKNRGRDRVQVFGRQLGERVAQQVSTAQRLRRALARGTLELHYQPIISLDTGMVIGAEALMRINSGREGDEPLSPSSLIDAAEDHGLTARLGRYLLEETTSQISRWEPQLGSRRFRVSVNVAPVQVANRDFSDAVAHALAAADVSPARLSLELTESLLAGVDPAVDSVVHDLVELGIAFGLDDFGGEGSSLGDLRRYPIEFIKIDRDMVHLADTDPTVEAIISSTVSLSRQLGVSTIAVGVERPEQVERLRRLGCDSAQGYLFAPPLPAAEFTELLLSDP